MDDPPGRIQHHSFVRARVEHRRDRYSRAKRRRRRLAGMMAKTQYYTATSIDGFIAAAGNSLDWLFQAETSSGKEDRFSAFSLMSARWPWARRRMSGFWRTRT
jgi:hypothetical protein